MNEHPGNSSNKRLRFILGVGTAVVFAAAIAAKAEVGGFKLSVVGGLFLLLVMVPLGAGWAYLGSKERKRRESES